MVSRTIGSIVFLLSNMACLERVTGEDVPLDSRFYAAEDNPADQNEENDEGASTPFSSEKEDSVTISGLVSSELDMAVDLDVRVPNPSAPGGMERKGKILLDNPGEFSVDVPKNIGLIEFEVFQDINSDGPSGEDPSGKITFMVEEDNISDLEIKLVIGARGVGPTHQEVAPEEGTALRKGIPDNPDPFNGIEGERIELMGRLVCENCDRIDLDIFTPDDGSSSGRKMLGKMKFPVGEYIILVPENYGVILLEAFVDMDGNGPSKDDLMGIFAQNPIQIGTENLSGIDITLEKQADGKMPMTAH